MIKQFISLEWKQFFRSASFGKSIALKILMVFLAVYFIVIFLIFGVSLLPFLQDKFPDQDPLNVVNNFLFYWLLFDLGFRFFFQKLPVMSVKPLLILPIKKSKIIHFILKKSALSFFNFLPLFGILPFAIMLLINNYAWTTVLAWVVLLILFILISNFLNFIIESFSANSELQFLPIIILIGGLFALNYFNIIDFSNTLSLAVNACIKSPWFISVPLGLLVLCYGFNYRLLIKKLYLDNALKTKIKEVNTTNLEWTRWFGTSAPFMQLDLKLIWRNKRPRSSIFLIVFGLLYGLFFYPNPNYQDSPMLYGFVGIFITGIFLINFGQFIPAWDSSYYKLLMSQNLKYKDYLTSKYHLMVLSVVVLFLLSIPYVYFGWKILVAHFAAAIYNIGINTHVLMWGGAYNRKKINLTKSAAFNYQGTGAVQWLIGIPLFLTPIIIYTLFYFMFNFYAGIGALILSGLIGIVLHTKWMNFISKKYILYKHKMITAFSQED